MLKKLLILSSVFIFLLICIQTEVNAGNTATVNQGERNNDLNQTTIISMLSKNIDMAITYYYDEYRGHDLFDASVISIVKPKNQGWGTHDITVQVYTFSGAHNPPYGTEIITFRISLDKEPLLIEYTHKDND